MGKGRVIAGLGIIGSSIAALIYFLRRRRPSEYGVFYGNIVNATTKMPIAGKPVYIGDYQSLSDENGYFEVAVAPGTYSALTVEGFMPYVFSMTIEEGQEIDLGAISLTPLLTTGVFHGYISNAEASGKRVDINGYLSTNPIAADGYFEVAVAPGTYSTLTVAGFVPYTFSMTIGAGQEIDLGTISLTLIATEGCLQGYVLNKDTGAKIPHGNALITIDGTQFIYNTADELGGYRTPILKFGMHHFQVNANNFVIGEFDLEISQPVTNYNFELEPLPPAPPGEWSEGVEVQHVYVEPSAAYRGETVNIDVYIQYGIDDPGKYPTPATISGTVTVDGQKIKDTFSIDFRNPTLRFPFVANKIGEFTAVAQDKSAKFTIAEKPVGTYYWPWGGIRIPRCLGFVIPAGSHLSPDEDFVYPASLATGDFLVGYFPACSDFRCFSHFSEDELRSGYPTNWDPSAASVTDFTYYIREGIIPSGVDAIGIIVVPTSFSCPPYWDSKEELAQIIAQPLIEDMSGIKKGMDATKSGAAEGYYTFQGWDPITDIPGFPQNVDPIRGVSGWAKPIEWGKDWIYCPYCGKATGHTAREYSYSPRQSLAIARKLLEHIESEHPDHSLIQPAWF